MVEEKVKRSLDSSYKDGVFAAGMVGFTQDYFTPFLLLIGGTTAHVGLLNAIPNLFASLSQLKSADLTERLRSRKSVVTFFVLLQALLLLPLAAMAVSQTSSPLMFIVFVTLFTAFGAFAGPPWASMMGDLVGGNRRGEYFGWRNRVLGYIIVGMTFVAGIILTVMGGYNVFLGFMILFGFAAVFRLVSWYFLSRMYDPPVEYKREYYFSFISFLGRVRDSNFAKFVLFIALMNFSVNLAGPYFAVLMLKDLNFSYIVYTIVNVTSTLTIYTVIGRWGRIADRAGNMKVIRFTAPIISLLPLLWVLNQNFMYLVVVQVLSGFVWAGFNLSASNFIYDSVTPQKRTRCIAYFNVLNGLALCAGAILGGYLIEVLPPTFGHKILTLFLVSTALRLAVSMYMPGKLREVRQVDKIESHELFFSVIGVRPHLGIERKTIRY